MSSQPSQQTSEDPSEAVQFVKYKQREMIAKKNRLKSDAVPHPNLIERKVKTTPPKPHKAPARVEPKQSKQEKPKSSPKAKDRTTLPREQMSGHRVGVDIPIRIQEEYLHRKKKGMKTTLAETTDDILNVGLRHFEKLR